jgi:hypothetical protein
MNANIERTIPKNIAKIGKIWYNIVEIPILKILKRKEATL